MTFEEIRKVLKLAFSVNAHEDHGYLVIGNNTKHGTNFPVRLLGNWQNEWSMENFTLAGFTRLATNKELGIWSSMSYLTYDNHAAILKAVKAVDGDWQSLIGDALPITALNHPLTVFLS